MVRRDGEDWENERKRVYFLQRWPSPASMKRVKQRVKELTPRAACHRDLRETIQKINPVLRGRGAYFATGNATAKFTQVDSYAWSRLRALVRKRKGRNLRAGEMGRWTRHAFYRLGLHKLLGTIRYPGQARLPRPERPPVSRVRESRTHGLNGGSYSQPPPGGRRLDLPMRIGWVLVAVVTVACGNVVSKTDAANDAPTVGSCSITPADGTTTGDVTATPTFSGATATTPPVTYECSVDGGAFVTCTSGMAITGFSGEGSHSLVVRATDGRGNATTQCTSTWTVCLSGSQMLSYTGTLQTFTLKSCVTSISIDAYGAQGGGTSGGVAAGGKGARMSGTFAISGGTVLNVVVGGMGTTKACYSPQTPELGGGGGGGSFVWKVGETTPLIVAAGGGGSASLSSLSGATFCTSRGGQGGQTAGALPGSQNSGTQYAGAAGTGGGGGGAGGSKTSFDNTGAGGGGWSSAGASFSYAPTGGTYTGGSSGAGGGGDFAGGTGGAAGGYGGGGAALCSGAGGGGYNGGGGGEASYDGSTIAINCGGGGGGSFNIGTSQTNQAGVRTGNGQVIISW